MVTTIEKPRCPKCDSVHVYHRVKWQTFRCQTCGHTWPQPVDQR